MSDYDSYDDLDRPPRYADRDVPADRSRAAGDWDSLGLVPQILELVKKAGYERPTPIQSKAIPVALSGRDLIASAQTGSGKTASFCLPMIQKMMGRRGTFGLILAPTREIALQTQETIEQFGNPLGVRSAVLIGGVNIDTNFAALGTSPQILVGTPGRICDNIERGKLWLEYIEMLVLDEADRMLDMGFAAELSRITHEIPDTRQTLLFSATIPPSIESLGRRILHNPTHVTIGKPVSATPNVEQQVLWMNDWAKRRELRRLFEREPGTIIVFTRTKEDCFRMWRASLDMGIEDSTYISSNKRQADREKALAGFKDGTFRILFATDVAARGIHVENVALVINYDLPKEPEDYIHRIGRTGRKDARGYAVTLATPKDRGIIHRIERLLGKRIPAETVSDFRPSEKGGGDRRRGGGGRGGSHHASDRRGSDRGGERRHGEGSDRGGDRPRSRRRRGGRGSRSGGGRRD